MLLNFRLANRNDLFSIKNMYSSAIESMKNQNIEQWDEIYPNSQILSADINKKQMHIAFSSNEIVSSFVLNKECDEEYDNGRWKYTNYFIVHRLCVNPSFQNCHIGTLTMKYIEEIAKNMGADSLRLDCFTENPSAIHMYKSLGYDIVGFADWRKGRFYLMEKLL